MKLRLHIPERFNKKTDTILVALSGGADSVALLHALTQEKYNVKAAHVNYRLRGAESLEDENFCVDLCKNLEVELFVMKAEPILESENIQVKARNIRYEFFEELCWKNQIAFIATAHNANDRFESLLMNLSTGSGPFGFLGIPLENGKIIRPILQTNRPKIEEYCAYYHLNFRTDSSNLSDKYTRNKIRHHITPRFEEIHPNSMDNYTQSSQNLYEVLAYFKDEYTKFKSENIENKFGILSTATSGNPIFLKQWYSELGFETPSIYAIHDCEKDLNEWHSNLGRLLKYRARYYFKPKTGNETPQEPLKIKEVGKYHYSNFSIEIKKEIGEVNYSKDNPFDFFATLELLECGIEFRPLKTGDSMTLLGMQGRKKLSDILTDKHINRFQKEIAFVLTDKDDEIIWLCAYKRSSKYLVEDYSKEHLSIRITYNEPI